MNLPHDATRDAASEYVPWGFVKGSNLVLGSIQHKVDWGRGCREKAPSSPVFQIVAPEAP